MLFLGFSLIDFTVRYIYSFRFFNLISRGKGQPANVCNKTARINWGYQSSLFSLERVQMYLRVLLRDSLFSPCNHFRIDKMPQNLAISFSQELHFKFNQFGPLPPRTSMLYTQGWTVLNLVVFHRWKRNSIQTLLTENSCFMVQNFDRMFSLSLET